MLTYYCKALGKGKTGTVSSRGKVKLSAAGPLVNTEEI